QIAQWNKERAEMAAAAENSRSIASTMEIIKAGVEAFEQNPTPATHRALVESLRQGLTETQWARIPAIRAAKNEKRGAFNERLVMVSTVFPDGKEFAQPTPKAVRDLYPLIIQANIKNHPE